MTRDAGRHGGNGQGETGVAPGREMIREWIEEACRLPEPTRGESAVIREIWKASLGPSMKRRWAWAASALAVAVNEDIARVGTGIGAFGWDGESDLSDALRKVATAEPGLGLMVLFEGADAAAALDAARDVMAQPDTGLRELGMVVRGDKPRICRIVRVLRRDDAGSGVFGELAPRAAAEIVEKAPGGFSANVPTDIPETRTARLLLVRPEADGPRDVGVLGMRASDLSPGTWVVLCWQNAPDRGRRGPKPGTVEVFALGRISRQPDARAQLLSYDRLTVRDRPVRVPLLATRKDEPASGMVSLAAATAAFGETLEDIDRVAPSMAVGDILAELPHLPVRFAESVAAAVNAGKDLLLVGTPGSGKTTMAIGLARAFYQAGFVDEDQRVVGGDRPESWNLPGTVEDWRGPLNDGFRSRRTPPLGASGLLVVDDLTAEALPVLIRELAERARTSDPRLEKLRAIATALPRAVLDEWAMPRHPSRHLVVMRLPPPSLDALLAVIEQSHVLADPVKTALVAAVRESADWLTFGVVSDVVRYLEELQNASQPTDMLRRHSSFSRAPSQRRKPELVLWRSSFSGTGRAVRYPSQPGHLRCGVRRWGLACGRAVQRDWAVHRVRYRSRPGLALAETKSMQRTSRREFLDDREGREPGCQLWAGPCVFNKSLRRAEPACHRESFAIGTPCWGGWASNATQTVLDERPDIPQSRSRRLGAVGDPAPVRHALCAEQPALARAAGRLRREWLSAAQRGLDARRTLRSRLSICIPIAGTHQVSRKRCCVADARNRRRVRLAVPATARFN